MKHCCRLLLLAALLAAAPLYSQTILEAFHPVSDPWQILFGGGTASLMTPPGGGGFYNPSFCGRGRATTGAFSTTAHFPYAFLSYEQTSLSGKTLGLSIEQRLSEIYAAGFELAYSGARLKERNNIGRETGTVIADGVALTVPLRYSILLGNEKDRDSTQYFHTGFALGAYGYNIASAQAWVPFLTLGVSKDLTSRLAMALSFKNTLSRMTYSSQSFTLPPSVRAGARLRLTESRSALWLMSIGGAKYGPSRAEINIGTAVYENSGGCNLLEGTYTATQPRSGFSAALVIDPYLPSRPAYGGGGIVILPSRTTSLLIQFALLYRSSKHILEGALNTRLLW